MAESEQLRNERGVGVYSVKLLYVRHSFTIRYCSSVVEMLLVVLLLRSWQLNLLSLVGANSGWGEAESCRTVGEPIFAPITNDLVA